MKIWIEKNWFFFVLLFVVIRLVALKKQINVFLKELTLFVRREK